jgi:hypothetical protein
MQIGGAMNWAGLSGWTVALPIMAAPPLTALLVRAPWWATAIAFLSVPLGFAMGLLPLMVCSKLEGLVENASLNDRPIWGWTILYLVLPMFFMFAGMCVAIGISAWISNTWCPG